jgi:hypothetical protein
MPAYIYRVRRREPKGGAMAVLPPDPPVVAVDDSLTLLTSKDAIRPTETDTSRLALTEPIAPPKPRRRRRKAAPK